MFVDECQHGPKIRSASPFDFHLESLLRERVHRPLQFRIELQRVDRFHPVLEEPVDHRIGMLQLDIVNGTAHVHGHQ